eukprot:9109529-Pyramimonas_sp.AAC.1
MSSPRGLNGIVDDVCGGQLQSSVTCSRCKRSRYGAATSAEYPRPVSGISPPHQRNITAMSAEYPRHISRISIPCQQNIPDTSAEYPRRVGGIYPPRQRKIGRPAVRRVRRVSAGVRRGSTRTNQTQEEGHILMTDQSDTGNPTAWLDTETVKRTVKTLLSHPTRELNFPANFLRTPYVRVEP